MMDSKAPLIFTFRVSELGDLGQCLAEMRLVGPSSRLLVILSDSIETGCGPLLPLFELIATQFYKKFLGSVPPDAIIWALHSPQGLSREENYQKIALRWDGERFSRGRQQARINRKAFLSLIDRKVS
jgi:hypothetical protein